MSVFAGPVISAAELAEATGWELKPEGLCKGDRCVPVEWATATDMVDLRVVAAALGQPLVTDEPSGLTALGPEVGRALATARLPKIVLPDLEGRPFDLASLAGRKLLLVAWASW